MIDAQAVTGRIMKQMSSLSGVSGNSKSSLVLSYLSAFGITPPVDLSEIPPVFKEVHSPEWNVFVKEYGAASKTLDKNSAALNTILEFIRYMKHMGLNPFIHSIKPPQAALNRKRLDAQSTYENLLYAKLQDIVALVLPVLRNTHLFTNLVSTGISRTKVEVKDRTHVLYTSYVLHTRRKTESLDAVLARMQGFLYSGGATPAQLCEEWKKLPPTSKLKAKSSRDKAAQLLGSTSTIGWLAVSKTTAFSVYLIRAKDNALVMRIEVPIVLDADLGHAVKAIISRLWVKAFSQFTKK